MSSTETGKPFWKAVGAAAEWVRERAALAGMVFLCALSVSSIYLGLTVAVAWLPAPIAYNAGAAVLCVTVCTILYYGCLSEEKGGDKSIPFFMMMLLCDAVLVFIDMASYLVEGIAELRTLNLTLSTLYCLLAVILMYQLWRYMRGIFL